MVQNRWRSTCKNAKVKLEVESGSDHKLRVLKFRIMLQTKRNQIKVAIQSL